MSQTLDRYSLDYFSQFFQENKDRFLKFAYSYLRSREEAEDVLMMSFSALWEHRDHWCEEGNLHAVLLTIIKHNCLNQLEHRRVQLRVEDEMTCHEQRELDFRISMLKECNPERIFNAEIRQIVRRSLTGMPEQSRKIFELSRQRQLTNAQIAAQLGISVKTVEAHITKTLKLLRIELKDYLFSLLF